jgi:hypothetical protein
MSFKFVKKTCTMEKLNIKKWYFYYLKNCLKIGTTYDIKLYCLNVQILIHYPNFTKIKQNLFNH